MIKYLAIFLFLVKTSLYSQQLYVSSIVVAGPKEGGSNYCDDYRVGDNPIDRSVVSNSTGARIEFDRVTAGYPGSCVALCAWITAVVETTADATMGVDDLTFEIFKFKAGANPLDPSSTPPIRTISMHNVSSFDLRTAAKITKGPYCTAWDGSYNIEGFWGKTNGQFGFRVTVRTNEVSPTAGNINIQQTSAFPGQNQNPITVDVTNIHVVKATPTVVGKITGVGAAPYNILYRLSKDATVTITIEDPPGTVIRTIQNSAPRFGEIKPDGTLTNGDFWDGRNNSGQFVQPKTYFYRIQASARDSYGWDNAQEYTDNISIEPLQITDVSVKDLGPLATDVAIISFMLTEDATVYLDIYPPNTTFDNINCAARSTSPSCNPSNQPLRSYSDIKSRRQTVSFYWDGKDSNGKYLCDGNYVFALSAEMPGEGGSIWTQRLSVGNVAIAKGDPLAFLTPSTTVIGSSPTVAGLNPFFFKFRLQRPSSATLIIKDMNGNTIRTIAQDEPMSSGIDHNLTWDGKTNDGSWASAGTYMANLTIRDPYACATNNLFTHKADFNVNLFRIVDVVPQHIIGFSTLAAVSYQLSQSMWVDLKIYKQDFEINPNDWPWERGDYILPNNIIYSVSGMRPGRYKVTEYWDGRDEKGYVVDDGRYPFTIVAYTTGTTKIYAQDKAYGYIDVSKGKIVFLSFNVTPDIATLHNSSEVVKLPPHQIEYSVSRYAAVSIKVTDFYNGKVVAKITDNAVRDPFISYKDYWDGRCFQPDSPTTCKNGEWMIGGSGADPLYNINIYARDLYANPNKPLQITTVTITVENYPFRLYDLAIAPLIPDAPAQISYQISETMKVSIKIYKPGTSFIGTEPICSGGTGEESCLVNKIIGTRPGRTLINESWYGNVDITNSNVKSGLYVFKIIASTDSTLIDDITGDCVDGTNSCDVLRYSGDSTSLYYIPVTQGYIDDVCDYFKKNSYFAPNPMTMDNGFFKLGLPAIGHYEVRIYNLAGEKVYSYNSKDYYPSGRGPRDRTRGDCLSGKTSTQDTNGCMEDVRLVFSKNRDAAKLAPGVYYAVFKMLSADGTEERCQFRKKILIP